jgi:hypothetical protein
MRAALSAGVCGTLLLLKTLMMPTGNLMVWRLVTQVQAWDATRA